MLALIIGTIMPFVAEAHDQVCEMIEDAILTNAGGRAERLGYRVAISGDRAILSAHQNHDVSLYAGAAYVYRFDGFSWVEEQQLTASDGATVDGFGASVAISGDTAIVGADRQFSTTPGQAYIFRFNGSGWVEEQKLVPSNGAPGDSFGVSVAINGDVAIVGAYETDDAVGAAYVFRFEDGSWVEEQKLVAADGLAGDLFGTSVAVDNDVAVIGAQATDELPGTNVGAAYVFRFNGSGWIEEQRLGASDARWTAHFGCSVSISDQTVLVGARSAADAYVFRFDGISWVEEQKLEGRGYSFGHSVAISDDVAVVGAYQEDNDSDSAGAAYIYRFDGLSWVETQRLTASNAVADGWFGYSVAIDNGTPLIGSANDAASFFRDPCCPEIAKITSSVPAEFDYFGDSVAISMDAVIVGVGPGGDGPRTDVGWARVYRRAGSLWVEEHTLTSSHGATYGWFGRAVSISGDVAIVGSHETDVVGPTRFFAYIFRHNGSSWVEEEVLTATGGSMIDFGSEVAINGDIAVVAGNAGDGSGVGGVYVFRYDGSSWVVEQVLTASDGVAGDAFGGSLAISGNTIAVGAPRDDHSTGADGGSVYLFRFNGDSWVEEQKIIGSVRLPSDRFGASVGISADRVIVGGEWFSANGTPGSAYIFEFDGSLWQQAARLVPAHGSLQAGFGHAVAIEGDTAVISAYQEDELRGTNVGAVYIFRFDGTSWREERKFAASDGESYHYLGGSIGVSGDTLVAGAAGDDGAGYGSGAAYIFDLNCDQDRCACERMGDTPIIVDVFDLLAYLDVWFSGDAAAELTGDSPASVDVFDLLAFLDCWFPASAGGACP